LEEKRISRRELIRNVGIAGAVAWAAPVLTSLPASASVDKCKKKKAKKLCKGIDGNCINFFTQCGTCDNGVGDGSYCWETYDNNGNVVTANTCAADFFCSGTQTCSKQSDCPAGNVCATNNFCDCSGGTGFCTPRCCVGLAKPARVKPHRLGRTGSGR
jgi:hypothetical protein